MTLKPGAAVITRQKPSPATKKGEANRNRASAGVSPFQRVPVAKVDQAAKRIAAQIVATAGNSELAREVASHMPKVVAAILAGAKIPGPSGSPDRAMLTRMLGVPWATSATSKASGKANAGNAMEKLRQRLSLREAAPGAVIEPDGRVAVTQATVPARPLPF